jgi:hypothetical protein
LCRKLWYGGWVLVAAVVLVLASTSVAAEVTLEWTPPTTNADGTPLADLASYRLYQRLQGGTYVALPPIPAPASSAIVVGLQAGQIYQWQLSAVDTSGNESARSNEVTHTMAQLPTPGLVTNWTIMAREVTTPVWNCPCSLWSLSDTPAQVAEQDTNAVTLGVKVQAQVAGVITGVRYYKSTQNTGTHTAQIWSRDGQLLASATFSSAENTGTGWKTVMFATPVSIQAQTTYITSYHAPVGGYSSNNGYFTQAHAVGPLMALRDGEDGGNGVYRYGSLGFPSNTYQSSNYWVTPIFQPAP